MKASGNWYNLGTTLPKKSHVAIGPQFFILGGYGISQTWFLERCPQTMKSAQNSSGRSYTQSFARTRKAPGPERGLCPNEMDQQDQTGTVAVRPGQDRRRESEGKNPVLAGPSGLWRRGGLLASGSLPSAEQVRLHFECVCTGLLEPDAHL